MATIPRSSLPRPSARGFRFFPGIRGLLSVWCCALCLSPFANRAYGAPQQHEKSYALIYGTVWGPDERPLYGVRIKIRRADENKFRWELMSDHRGEFAQRVPASSGDYIVTADLKGYKYLSGKRLRLEEDVKVHIDNEEREDIGLHLKD